MDSECKKPVLNNLLPLKMGKVTTTRAVAIDMGLDGREREDSHIIFAQFVIECARRHREGDWGDVSDADAERNVQALVDGDRVLSAYKSEEYEKIWIITEADRSYTTIMFASEY